jgi:hypothetical protein
MPAWLTPLVAQVGRDVPALAAANHVLLNAYQPGEGIMVRRARVLLQGGAGYLRVVFGAARALQRTTQTSKRAPPKLLHQTP